MRKKLLECKEGFIDYEMEQQARFFEMALEKNYNIEDFLEKYMNSTGREMMDTWHPRLSQCDAYTLWSYLKMTDKTMEFKVGDNPEFNDSEVYWYGMAYSFLHYYVSLPFSMLYKLFPFEVIRGLYVWGHQMSWEGFADRLIRMYNEEVGGDYIITYEEFMKKHEGETNE